MIEIVKMGKLLVRIKIECDKCHTIFTCDDSDVASDRNLDYWYNHIDCPLCGKRLTNEHNGCASWKVYRG